MRGKLNKEGVEVNVLAKVGTQVRQGASKKKVENLCVPFNCESESVQKNPIKQSEVTA